VRTSINALEDLIIILPESVVFLPPFSQDHFVRLVFSRTSGEQERLCREVNGEQMHEVMIIHSIALVMIVTAFPQKSPGIDRF
jgi:hypothetical protein